MLPTHSVLPTQFTEKKKKNLFLKTVQAKTREASANYYWQLLMVMTC